MGSAFSALRGWMKGDGDIVCLIFSRSKRRHG